MPTSYMYIHIVILKSNRMEKLVRISVIHMVITEGQHVIARFKHLKPFVYTIGHYEEDVINLCNYLYTFPASHDF